MASIPTTDAPMKNPYITACLVTRGDIDLTPILDSLPDEWPAVIWNNGDPDNQDLAVYGRYQAILQARPGIVYVQDDDCLVDAEKVAAHYQPGRLVANMPRSRWDDYPDSCLVGWGAVFDRTLPFAALQRLPILNHPTFKRTCDVAFSALTPRTIIDIGFTHLPWAETGSRMFRQPGHKQERDQMLELCRTIRETDDDVREAA